MSLVDRAGVGAATWVAAGTALAVPLVAAQLWRPVVALPVLLVAPAVAVRVARLLPGVDGPRWAAAALVAVAVGSGVWAGATHAEHVVLRGVDQFVPLRVLEQRQGLLTVIAARVGTKLSLAVISYQVGAENTKPRLRDIVSETLAEFGVSGVLE